MPEKTILFVAPPQAVTTLFPAFREAGIQAGIADTFSGALAFVKKSQPSVIFSRAKIGTYVADSLLAYAEEVGEFPPIVVFAERGSAAEAQRFLELGAKDYWLEPLAWEKIKALIPAAPEERAPSPAASAAQAGAAAPGRPPGRPSGARPGEEVGVGFSIIGRHPAIQRVLALARQVAKSKATVLISGESGTGKEMFAKFLHAHSDRADKPFVALNCAALPEHLLESELFGHERGAFTGAIAKKLGKFELASGGAILLDEISEMDLGLQAKLLRVLQEGEFDRVGGMETVKVDVRVLATTNRRLEETVEEGKFRQDLYYRLNVIPLKLPPLRERGDDIMHLAEFFVDKFCKAYGLAKLTFSAEAREYLLSYEWPGNVRELQNLMERAVLLAGNGPIQKAHFLLDAETWPEFGEAVSEGADGVEGGEAAEPPLAAPVYPQMEGGPDDIVPLEVMERDAIFRSLDHTSGNRTQAAQLLGISVRTLRNKLNEYRKQGLDFP